MPTLPYEYIWMLFLAFVPPAFHMVVNPRIEAINRAKKGIKVKGEEDQWNAAMPMSKADKRRDLYAKVLIAGMSLLFAGLTLNKGL